MFAEGRRCTEVWSRFLIAGPARLRFVHRRCYDPATAPKMIGHCDRLRKINHWRKKWSWIKQLNNCLKFNQNVGRPASAMIPVPAPQLFNKVIHRFRGYMELGWQLNQLTVR
jgi:hypothetical protein